MNTTHASTIRHNIAGWTYGDNWRVVPRGRIAHLFIRLPRHTDGPWITYRPECRAFVFYNDTFPTTIPTRHQRPCPPCMNHAWGTTVPRYTAR